ncbi:unnamed protein product [Macrosiphum euphorbiae]|uniref:Secreted protein n=1 Tax=Macrosiphum euphorbiae TaxID=13131 RepID=A0AAV0Y8J3_9HEMI|nr:unnamed protein product [Macrosiphum euphorbiae]
MIRVWRTCLRRNTMYGSLDSFTATCAAVMLFNLVVGGIGTTRNTRPTRQTRIELFDRTVHPHSNGGDTVPVDWRWTTGNVVSRHEIVDDTRQHGSDGGGST